MDEKHLTRRTFIMGAALAASGLTTMGGSAEASAVSTPRKRPRVRRISPNEKINIAGIGIGGQGRSDLANCKEHNIVALCDVDLAMFGRPLGRDQGNISELFPKAKLYQDYREMLDKQKNIDAVFIATPDHNHAPAAMCAMRHGKHVYCEKPLTYTVDEAKKLAATAKEFKLATQMGNAGQADETVRVSGEYVASGALGPVREIHVWTDRPIWPQAIDRPEGSDPVPDTLNWDLWLGPAPERPFKSRVYHPFVWRGWKDFGTGALGDMGCHAFHPIFRVMKFGHPTSIEATSTDKVSDRKKPNPETYPLASIVTYDFPAREGMPPCRLIWYDGGAYPARPVEYDAELPWPNGGTLYIGEKGKMLGHVLIPEARRKEIGQPPMTLPRSPGHFKEWFNACKGGQDEPGASFDSAALVTQVVLLGNIALQTGKRLQWDGEKVTNIPDANKYLTREYRTGWSL